MHAKFMPVMINILVFMVVFTGVAANSQGCSVRPSVSNFGSCAVKYAVSCLPDVKYLFPASWAGHIPIPSTTNDELFFWLFESEDQSKKDNLISLYIPTNS